MRKFSIPYTTNEPDMYMKAIDPYLKNIDSVYLGLSSLCSNHLQSEFKNVDQYDTYAFEFLMKSKGITKRLLTLNSGCYQLPCSGLVSWCNNVLFPFIEYTKLDGCICTDFNMAKYIHIAFPNIEIHTSCNCYQWLLPQMKLWQDQCGVSVFNPPREILRTPSKLKEFHDAGFKIKAILNESCLFGCPQSINHCMGYATDTSVSTDCMRGDPSNFFKCNWILPEWLPELDEYVDIYKLSGRTSDVSYITNLLDVYINTRSVSNILDLFIGRNTQLAKEMFKSIPSNEIPKRLLTCELKGCGLTCTLCSQLSERYKK